jgi:NAD(P)-dependent dehydrogenase (short-subunit alcohol dehydrogenase family)
MQLKDKVCLIAGASGAIGHAIASRFHQEGAKLALHSHSHPAAIAEWQNSNSVTQVKADITSARQVQQLVDEVIAKFGTLDCLVNCTGVLGPIGATSDVDEKAWSEAININLIGSFYLTRAALKPMLAKKRGKIMHFSGGGAAYGRPFYSAYSASKAALVRFAESVAEEVRDSNIDVNAIAPGPVNSRMWDQVRSLANPDAKTIAELKKMEETGGVPPDRAAELAVFLASNRSNGLTGRLISAVWDDWNSFEQRIPELMRSEAGTLRRVPLV